MGAVLQVATRFSATGSLAVPIRKYQLSLIAPTPPSTVSVDFVFFFPDWTQRIPLCTSFDDMVNVTHSWYQPYVICLLV
jgi:THO complex subunit 2